MNLNQGAPDDLAKDRGGAIDAAQGSGALLNAQGEEREEPNQAVGKSGTKGLV